MATIQIRPGDSCVWSLGFTATDGSPQTLEGTRVEITLWGADLSVPAVAGWWEHDGLVEIGSDVVGPDGATGGSIVVADPPSGMLVLTLFPVLTAQLTPVSATRYRVRLGTSPELVFTWDEGDVVVGPDPARAPVPGGFPVESRIDGTTRLQLRRDILKDLGDVRILSATADGSNVEFIDWISLVGEPGAYAGREFFVTGGTPENLGQTRYVTGSSQARRALGFGIALPAPTRHGDEAELVNLRGTAYRIQDVHEAINRAIRSMRDRALVPVPTSFPSYAPGQALALPADLKTVEEVQWYRGAQNGGGTPLTHALRKATRPNGYGWWIDRANRTLNVTGSAVAQPPVLGNPEGAVLVVWGLGRPRELFADTDVTPLDSEWLVMAAQAELARANFMKRNTPEVERTMFMLQQAATALRVKVTTRRGPYSEDI